MDARKGAYAGNPEPRARALGPRFRGDELMLYRLDAIPTHSSRALPVPFEAGLEALGEVAGCGLAHRAGDAERSAEQLLLGAQRAQPLVVGAGNVGAERHAGVGRQEVKRSAWLVAQLCTCPVAFGSDRVIETPFCHVNETSSPTGTERLNVVPSLPWSCEGSRRVSIAALSQPSGASSPGAVMVAQPTPVD